MVGLLIFGVLAIPSPAYSNGGAHVSVSPVSSVATTCATHTFAIQVADVVDLTGYHLEFSFDPSVLAVTAVVNGGFLNEVGGALYEPTNDIDNLAGKVSFGMAQKNNPSVPQLARSGTGDLVLVTVQALVPNGTATIDIDESLSMLVDWPNAFEIPFTVGDGTITTESCPPTALELSKASVLENEPIGTLVGLLATTDPEPGDTFTYSLVDTGSFPDNASFTISGNQLLTAASFDYESQFSYEIKIRTTDAGGKWFEAIFIVEVIDINEAPVAVADSYSTLKNQVLIVPVPGVLANDSDPEHDPLTAEKLTDPPASEGTVVFSSDGMLAYTPPVNWVGDTSFTYRAYDGELYSDPAVVTITVNETNVAPTGISLDNNQIVENAGVDALVGLLATTDPDPYDSFTYTLVSGAGSDDNALFNIVDNKLQANDSFDYELKNQFTIRIRSTDQGGLWVEQSFTIYVLDANDPPVAYSQTVTTDEETPVNITLTGSDQDLDDLTFVLVIAPTNGVLTWSPPTVIYTPNAAFFGEDSFQFKVVDEHNASSNTATVTIQVNDVNQAPSDILLSNDTLEENAGVNAFVGYLSTIDQDLLDTFTYTLVPGSGSDDNALFDIIGDQLVARDDLNFEEQAFYTIRVRSTDSAGEYFEKVFIIAVLDVNDPPVANDQEVLTEEDLDVKIILTGSDEDNDPLTFIVLDGPSHGSLTGTAPDLTYTPDPGFAGTDSFTFRIFDGTDYSPPATVTIVISEKGTSDYYLPVFFF